MSSGTVLKIYCDRKSCIMNRDHVRSCFCRRMLKAEIEELQRGRDAEMDFGLERNACSLCMTEFGSFFDRGAACPWCRRKVWLKPLLFCIFHVFTCNLQVCKACRLCAYVQKKRRWMCTLCTKEWQLRKLSGDWLQVGKKIRMSNTSAAVFVLKSIVSMQFKHSANKDKKAVFLQESSSEANTSHKSPKFDLGKEGKIRTNGHVSDFRSLYQISCIVMIALLSDRSNLRVTG